MTMTESPPADTAVDEEPAAEPSTGGIYAALITADHKTIGRLFIAFSLLLGLGTVVVGVLVRLEGVDAAQPDHIFGGLNSYFQMWSLYRVAFVLLVLIPLFLGIAMVVVPLQIGATNVAFPRAALASFWAWLLGAGITVVAVFAGGGWGALDGVTGQERDAIALTLAGTAFMIVSLLVAALCVATTVVSARTMGMGLMKVPAFSWSMLVAASVWLFTLPIAVANIGLIYFDLRGRDPIAFGTPDAGIWAQLDWLFTQPAMYALLIPVAGIVADVVPVSMGTRAARHGVTVTAIGLLGLLSHGGWMQPYMTAPADHRDEFVYVAFGLAVILPVLALLGGALDSFMRGMRGGAGAPRTMLIAAVVAIDLAAGAVIVGGLRVIEPFELLERSTTGALFNAVVVSSLLGAVAGLWYWAPKILGTTLSEGAGRLAALCLVLGGVLLAAADAVAGFFLAPDFQATEPAESAVDVFNVIALVGMVIVALGVLMAVATVARTMRGGQPAAGDDPWDGHTLEWATTSPPPPDNFSEPLARVESVHPLLDQREQTTEEA